MSAPQHPSPAELRFAEAMVNSEAALRTFGTCEWDELGAGCRECGGIGAVWDDTDYDDMVEFMQAADREEEAGKRLRRAVLDVIGEPHPNELRSDVSDNTFASVDTTAGHLRRLRLALTALAG